MALYTSKSSTIEAVLVTEELITNLGPWPDWVDGKLLVGRTVGIEGSEFAKLAASGIVLNVEAGQYIVLNAEDVPELWTAERFLSLYEIPG